MKLLSMKPWFRDLRSRTSRNCRFKRIDFNIAEPLYLWLQVISRRWDVPIESIINYAITTVSHPTAPVMLTDYLRLHAMQIATGQIRDIAGTDIEQLIKHDIEAAWLVNRTPEEQVRQEWSDALVGLRKGSC